MGLEYKIVCSQVPDELDRRLRLLNGFSDYDKQHRLYYFRSPENQNVTQMPDASIRIESDGIYFNDHGGDAKLVSVVFRRLLDVVLAEADEVTIRGL